LPVANGSGERGQKVSAATQSSQAQPQVPHPLEQPDARLAEGNLLARRALPQLPPRPPTLFSFELKLLNELGLGPDLAEAKLTPGAKLIAEKLATLDWPDLARLKPSDAQNRELQQFLQSFMINHLEKIPANRAAAL